MKPGDKSCGNICKIWKPKTTLRLESSKVSKKMRSLITGANGFTGSHLVQALQKQGHQVIGLVRKSSNLSRLQNCQIDLVYGDITDTEILTQAMAGVDYVFHTAAYVELGIVDVQEMHRVNVDGTLAVISAAKASEVQKVIYCSTIGIYGDSRGEVIDETFQRQQKDFSSAYDRSKYLAQQLVDDFASQGLPIVSVMPSGIVGPDDPHFGPVVKLFTSGKLKWWVGGDRLTGVVHVDDLVAAMILALSRGTAGEHYIISTGELTTREMFSILGEYTGQATPKEIPEPLARIIAQFLELTTKFWNWNPPLSQERIHYIYDRCVRVKANKAREKLKWSPRSVSDTILSMI